MQRSLIFRKGLRYLLAWSLFFIAATSVRPQGTLWFNNFVPGEVVAPVFLPDGSRVSGPNYVIQLYAGSVGTDLLRLTAMGPPVMFGQREFLGYIEPNQDLLRVIPFAGSGERVWLHPRVWDSALGQTLEDFISQNPQGIVAYPTIFEITLGDFSAPAYMNHLSPFNWHPVATLIPEPQSWVLLLAGFSVVAFVRYLRCLF
jgi:hypothetical protein